MEQASETFLKLKAGIEELAQTFERDFLDVELMRAHLAISARDARAVADAVSAPFVSMAHVVELMERTKRSSEKFHAAYRKLRDRFEHAQLPSE